MAEWLNELEEWVGSDSRDLLNGALIVNRSLDEDADCEFVRQELLDISERITDHSLAGVLASLESLGFKGAVDSYARFENSRLDYVLKERRGIPISLGIVAVLVSRNIGLTAQGINFPGHFLVQIEGAVVDPFELKIVAMKESDSGSEADQPSNYQTIPVATSEDILFRMFSNIQELALQGKDYISSLNFNDALRTIRPAEPRVLWLRSGAWLGLGNVSAARETLEDALELTDDDVRLKEVIQRQLSGLPEVDDEVLN